MHPLPAGAPDGFIRVPRAYLALPISPGAKVLLVHLCAAADENGESWYSYDDIAELIGRSKASVTAYVQELVSQGLIDAIRQTMANGYNYRRKLCIRGWRDLLSHWADLSRRKRSEPSSPPALSEASEQDTSPAKRSGQAQASASGFSLLVNPERGVQDTECKDPSGPNKIHQTKTPDALPRGESIWTEADEKAWRQWRPSDSDPVGVAYGTLSEETAKKALKHLDKIQAERAMSLPKDSVLAAIEQFSRKNRLAADAEALVGLADILQSRLRSTEALKLFIDALDKRWKPHWRRLPTPAQLTALVDEMAEAICLSPDTSREIGRFMARSLVLKIHGHCHKAIP